MFQDLASELRRVAQRLSGRPEPSRAETTREFWSLARQFRAGLPPLLLPHRSGSRKGRIGYLAARSACTAENLAALFREHSPGAHDVWLYTLGAAQGPLSVAWARTIDLARRTELQAARAIAEADLDVLIDLDGGALAAMPLLVALLPARAVIEPLFEPVGFADSRSCAAVSDTTPGISQWAQLARMAADAPREPARQPLDSPAELNGRLDAAIHSHQAGELGAARDAYEGVLARYAEHPVAAYLFGQLLHQQGRSIEAIPWLQRAVRAAPEFRDAHYALAQRLADSRRWDEAASAYRCAVDLTPRFAAGWSGLGLAAEQEQGAAGHSAIEYLERAVALEPDTLQWRFNLGAAQQRRGNLAAARQAYEQVLARSPDHVEALFNLGAVAQDQGDFSGAIAAYRAAQQRQPGLAAIYPQLGACLQLTGQIEAWLETFRRYRAACPESLPMAVYGLEASMAAGDPAAHADWRDRSSCRHVCRPIPRSSLTTGNNCCSCCFMSILIAKCCIDGMNATTPRRRRRMARRLDCPACAGQAGYGSAICPEICEIM